jgi:hypothetical protein
MDTRRDVFFLALLLGLCGGAGVFSQENGLGETTPDTTPDTIPGVLLRPERGEALRYPEDTVIGAMGRGAAPESAWLFAGDLLSALVTGNTSALAGIDPPVLDDLLETLGEIEAQSWRLGSGREEADGSVSFLVRFIGRDQWITGELYLRPPEAPEAGDGGEAPAAPDGRWLFDELSLEEKRDRGPRGITGALNFHRMNVFSRKGYGDTDQTY